MLNCPEKRTNKIFQPKLLQFIPRQIAYNHTLKFGKSRIKTATKNGKTEFQCFKNKIQKQNTKKIKLGLLLLKYRVTS